MFFIIQRTLGIGLVLIGIFAASAFAGPNNLPASLPDAALENQRGLQFFNHGYYDLLPHGRKAEAAQNFVQAEKAFQKAIATDPDYIEAHRHLACLYHTQKKFNNAAAEYARVIQLEPYDLDTYALMAVVQTELGNINEAIQYLELAKTKTTNRQILQKLDEYIAKIKQAEHSGQ